MWGALIEGMEDVDWRSIFGKDVDSKNIWTENIHLVAGSAEAEGAG